MEFQTRSDETGLLFFSTLQDAYDMWKKDPTIWKISWYDGTNDYRWRPKTKQEDWSPESEERLANMSEKYKNAKNTEIFWVQQYIMPPNHQDLFEKFAKKQITDSEFEKEYSKCCLEEVLSDEEFRQRFNLSAECQKFPYTKNREYKPPKQEQSEWILVVNKKRNSRK